MLRRLALRVPTDSSAVPSSRIGRSVPVASSAAPPFFITAQSGNAAQAADCLTSAVYYEARSEPAAGQEAVAQVVLNRVRDRAFPASICGVVYQQSGARGGCQFSFVCDGSMNRAREQDAWAHARQVAAAALSGFVYAPVGSATYYHARSVLPWWSSSLTRVGSVGSHVFYRWRNDMERALAFSQTYAGEERHVALPGRNIDPLTEAPAIGVIVHFGTALDVHHGVLVHRGTITLKPTPRTSFGVRVHFGSLPKHGEFDVAPVSMPGDATIL